VGTRQVQQAPTIEQARNQFPNYQDYEQADYGIYGIRGTADEHMIRIKLPFGAMTADQLRVPWISIYAERGHEQDWFNWCESKYMIWNPIDMNVHTLSWARDFAVPQLSALGARR
jgi:hypothetical protein